MRIFYCIAFCSQQQPMLRMGFIYSHDCTETILYDLGKRIRVKNLFLEETKGKPIYSSKVAFTVFDNCLVNFNTSHEGIRSDGDGSQAYLFIDWFVVPIRDTLVADEDYSTIRGQAVTK